MIGGQISLPSMHLFENAWSGALSISIDLPI